MNQRTPISLHLPEQDRQRKLRDGLIAFSLYLILALVFTWPLILHPFRSVIGPFYGDNLEYVWKIWWVKHAIFDLGASPWFQPEIYAPYGYPLAYGEITPMHTFLGLPLTVLFGPIFTYNFFILASTVLSGFFTYLYARHLQLSPSAAFTAGAIFALCPYRMARIAGHLPLIDTQWLPLTLLFLDRFFQQPNWKDSLLSGLFFAASSLSSWYYGMMIGLLLPVLLLARWREYVRSKWRQQATNAWPGVAVAGLLIIPFLLPYLNVQQMGEAVIPLEQTAFWSASLTDYLTPNPLQMVWGQWVQEHLTLFREGLPYEFILSLGYATLLLALYGWRKGRLQVGQGWGWLIAISWVLSLGPVFKLFGAAIPMPVPANVSDLLNSALDGLGRHSLVNETYSTMVGDGFLLPLPALFLRWFLPGLAGMRSWGRFAIFAVFGISVLCGQGVEWVKQDHSFSSGRTRLRTVFVTSLLLGLALFEFYPGPRALIQPGPRLVDHWFAAKPEKALVIQMPLASALSSQQMFYSMYHGQAVASGYGTYFPILFEQRYEPLKSFPSDSALDLLAGWGKDLDPSYPGVRYILIDERDISPEDPFWQRVADQNRLQLLENLDGIRVYTIQ